MKYFGPKQAAYHLNVSVRTLEEWRAANRGPIYYKVEGRIYYKEEDLDIFLDESRVVPEEQPQLPFGVLIELEMRRREKLKTDRAICGGSDLSLLPIFAIKAG